MYRIEEPIYFYLFSLIAVLFLVYIATLIWKKRKQKKFAASGLLQRLAPDTSPFKFGLKFVLIALSMAFMVLGLSNPKMGVKLKTMKREGVDVVFALDVSRSMDAQDVKPSRLKKSRRIINQIIDELGADRVGIIVYAGTAQALVPITTDHAAAKMFLESADTDMLSSQGTAIVEALNMAKTYYDNDEQTNRYLVLLSDGEDHEASVESAAQELAEEGVKIYTIGVGTEKGAPIPILRIGNRTEYKKDREGNVVITKRNDEKLKELAQTGNGAYFDGVAETEQTIADFSEIIANAEKTEFETKEFSDYKDQFQWFVGIALLILLIDAFIFDKRTAWVKKVDLFNEKRTEI